MGTYFKELVNFDGGNSGVELSLCVINSRGVCRFRGGFDGGSVLLLCREGEFSCGIENGGCEFDFQTGSRSYYVQILRDGEVVLEGGNCKNLASEREVPKVIASDAFEASVADFNYYEKELGEVGKTADSIIKNASITEVIEEVKEEIGKVTVEEVLVEEIISEPIAEPKAEPKVEVKKKPTKKQPETAKRTAETPKQKSGKSKKADKTFFDSTKTEVEKMLTKFPKEPFLEDVLENSKWAKVEFSKGVYYAVGIIYADDMLSYIGYGVLGDFKNPPEFDNPQFVPLDITKPAGKGYFLMFQKAENVG